MSFVELNSLRLFKRHLRNEIPLETFAKANVDVVIGVSPNMRKYNRPWSYVLERDRYLMLDAEGNVHDSMDRICFAYSRDDQILMKHGNPRTVQAWMRHQNERATESFLQVVSLEVAPPFPVEEIHKVLDCSGYLQILINRLQKEQAS